MSERARWESLTCVCGSEAFVKLYMLRRHTQGGLSEEPSGLRCAGCGKKADTAILWQQMQRRKLEMQLAEMQEQIAAIAAGPATMPDSLPS